MDHAVRAKDRPRKPFNVMLTEQQKVWLDWLARQRDISRGAVLREALQRMHEQERTSFIRREEQRVDR